MPTEPLSTEDLDALRARVREDTPFWAQNFARIVNKAGELVPFKLKPAQLELDRQLEGQRDEGKPMRAIVLKARQLGISTYVQAKLMHRCTLRERYDAVVVAHDRETASKLYRIAETVYAHLPDDAELKPATGQYRRQQFLHFTGDGLWRQGQAFPDSRYLVDTAGEFHAGRGGTYRGVHASELAFWPQAGTKLAALKSAVPRTPETLFVIESTANGFNEFKSLWDDAVAGRSGYIAFFWPWWKEEEYVLPFASEAERERFIVADPSNPYAEEEGDLVEHHELTLEQLNWRRQAIADECNGDIHTFHAEYPSTPQEAFVSTGRKVFVPYRSAQLLRRVEDSDPRAPTDERPGPVLGDFEVAAKETHPSRTGGTIEVPSKALWVPREAGVRNPTPPWRFWLPPEGGSLRRQSEYVIAVDVSGGKTETTKDPDWHAVQVIDHRTREQVAEYRSRIDPDLLAEQVLLAALWFNKAVIAVERTGSWGQPVIRMLWFDYHYPHLYRSKRVGHTNEKTESRLGWDTTQRTKPLLVAGMAELLRTEDDGIRSRDLAEELAGYTRTESGVMQPEPGRYDDLLMAYMIAQQVARELPLKGGMTSAVAPVGPAPLAGLGAYDPRY